MTVNKNTDEIVGLFQGFYNTEKCSSISFNRHLPCGTWFLDLDTYNSNDYIDTITLTLDFDGQCHIFFLRLIKMIWVSNLIPHNRYSVRYYLQKTHFHIFMTLPLGGHGQKLLHQWS